MQNDEQNYQDTVKKLLDRQRQIMKYLRLMKEADTMPAALGEAMGPAGKWAKAAKDSTLESAPSLEAPEALSKALQARKKTFNEQQVREADDYDALLGDLKKIIANRQTVSDA